jgi:hypothetical protein
VEKKLTLTPEIRSGVLELLFHFMRTFDEKDWAGMGACLTQSIDCDYSSFRGSQPGKMTREQYVAQRKAALSILKTQHNLSNATLALKGKSIEVECNFTILRFHPDFNGSKKHYLHSYGRYRFLVVRRGPVWHISAITQLLLVNDGNPKLHIGAGK